MITLVAYVKCEHCGIQAETTIDIYKWFDSDRPQFMNVVLPKGWIELLDWTHYCSDQVCRAAGFDVGNRKWSPNRPRVGE